MTRSIWALSLAVVLSQGCAEVSLAEETASPAIAEAKSALYPSVNNLWVSQPVQTRAQLSVCWENPGTFTQEREWVRDAVRTTWGWVANIEFEGWESCLISYRDIGIRIEDIANPGPHTQGLGVSLMNVTNGMSLNFTFNNWNPTCKGTSRESCIRKVAVHEFGHALGFAHEQLRDDRDADCTEGLNAGNQGTEYFGEWDLYSVMNYCNPNWNNHGLLSTTDRLGVQKYYGVNPPFRAAVVTAVTSHLL